MLKTINELQKTVDQLEQGVCDFEVVDEKAGHYGAMVPWCYAFHFVRSDKSKLTIELDASGTQVLCAGTVKKLWHIPMIPLVFGKKRRARQLALHLIAQLASIKQIGPCGILGGTLKGRLGSQGEYIPL